ncbi:MAG: TolC family protein [Elusimicrobiota bacterium]
MRRSIPLLLSLAALAAFGSARAQPPVDRYSLDDSIRLAQLNNAQLQSAEQTITIARQRVQEATFLFFPEVGLQASATRYDARYPFALRPDFRSILLFPSVDDNLFSGRAYLSLPLYQGGRHVNTLQMARAAFKQARSKYDAVKMDIAYEVTKAFYRLLKARAEEEAAAQTLRKAESAAQNGKGRWERVEAESLASELRSEVAQARHILESARLEFLKGLNKELDAPVEAAGRIETRAVEVDLKKALVWAAELRPELQSQAYKAQMDAIAVNLALGRRSPTVALGLDYELTGPRLPLKQNNWDATLGVRIPFSLDYWTQHTQKVAEQRQGELARSELQDKVQLEVRLAYEDLRYWQAEWPRRESEHERLSELVREGVQAAPGDGLDILRAELRLLKAHRSRLEAVTEHILSRARLERAVGRTLPEQR